MNYFIGIDIGTSGAKCVLIDEKARFVASAGREYPIITPRPGWAEQDPETWVAAAIAALQAALQESRVDPSHIAGIGLTGQMHSLACLDAAGKPLRPAILWPDTRSALQVGRLRRQIGQEHLAQWAGNPLAVGFMLASWAWLVENEPETARRTATLCLPKDYVRLRLTGKLGSEPSDASSTLLFDPHTRAWSAPLLEAAGLNSAQLPPLHESAEVAGGLLPEIASACGLIAGTPVVYGGSDQACQALAQGALEPGLLTVTIGTGGQLLAPAASPAHDPELRLHLFCHAAPNVWHLEAAILTAGLALRWLRDTAACGTPYNELANAASQVEAAREGLFFAPYLAGERTPHMDPTARAAFIGLGLSHGTPALTRAVMEGVVFALREGFDLMLGLGVPAKRVIAAGGAIRHPLWLHLLADVFARPILLGATPDATGVGAALLAGVGTGAWQDAASAARALPTSGAVVRPDPERSEQMEESFQTYRKIYPALRSLLSP
jgi:xylulokinase